MASFKAIRFFIIRGFPPLPALEGKGRADYLSVLIGDEVGSTLGGLVFFGFFFSFLPLSFDFPMINLPKITVYPYFKYRPIGIKSAPARNIFSDGHTVT